MKYFVKKGSIVREVWGNADTILFIFAGASAEFALNKAVDWLYFTGKLPADPLGRLFSTVAYARQIVFSENDQAIEAISKIAAIHKGVETKRGMQIPDWAYRDVLFMLIDYSIRAFEILQRKLTEEERAEMFNVFSRVGFLMGVPGLPKSYEEWAIQRVQHMQSDLLAGDFTADLYVQYKKHLGPTRFALLKQVQRMVVPQTVSNLLFKDSPVFLRPVMPLYKIARSLKLDFYIKALLLPEKYKSEIMELDVA